MKTKFTLLLVLSLFAFFVVNAQDISDKECDALIKEGNERFAHDDFKGALEKFKRAAILNEDNQKKGKIDNHIKRCTEELRIQTAFDDAVRVNISGWKRGKTLYALVETLDFSNKNLERLPKDVLKCENLKILNINTNNISELPEGFGKLVNLNYLNISNNKISKLNKEIGKLTKLNELYISDNPIGELPLEIGKLNILNKLDVRATALKKLPKEISQLRNLAEINLQNTNDLTLKEVCVAFANFTKQFVISTDTLSKKAGRLVILVNNVTEIPAEIGMLTELKGLRLCKTKINSVPAEISKLKKITHVDLRQNPDLLLKNVCIAFATSPRQSILTTNPETKQSEDFLLIRVDATSELPAEIGVIKNLFRLDLVQNNITALPPEIGNLLNLNQLDLNNNQIKTLPAEIGKLTNLKVLNLINNKISVLPAELGNLKSLTELFLLNNQLTTLPPEMGKLKNLTMLDLRNNSISTFPDEMKGLFRLTNLFLTDKNISKEEQKRIKKMLSSCEIEFEKQ